jgi:hypothetical protein
MEVHHHSKVHQEKKWKEYLFEFLMLFLAVTAGFFVENIREHLVEQKRARQYARSLVHDLEKDTAMVRVDIRQMGVLVKRIDSIAAYLKNKKINEIANSGLYSRTHFGFEYRPYTWNRATLQEIKNSGSLRYFTNDSVIMKISAYDAHTQHMDEDFQGDTKRNDQVSQERDRIVDMSYSFEMPHVWLPGYDSLVTVLFKKEAENNQPVLQLLTANINDVKILLNGYLEIKNNYKGRSEFELPDVIGEATELISLLKKEYHLKDE